MNELQQLMGDAYKDSMTLDDVNAFFKGKKFADLSTGNYVDKNKFDNTVNDLNKQLKDKSDLLNSKLTDEEKNKNASAEQAKEIERLKKLLSDNTITGNKNTVNGVLNGSREMLGIESTDADFLDFIGNITTEDTDKSTKIANYVSKVINDAYKKGKEDATKNALGDFGKAKGNGSNDADNGIGKLGKQLAELNKQKKQTFDYFK